MAPRPSYAHGQNFDFWDYNVAALLGAGGAGGQWFSLRKRVAEHFKTPSVANTHPHARALAPRPQDGQGRLLAQREGREGDQLQVPGDRVGRGGGEDGRGLLRLVPAARQRLVGVLGRLLLRDRLGQGAQLVGRARGRHARERRDRGVAARLRERRARAGRLPRLSGARAVPRAATGRSRAAGRVVKSIGRLLWPVLV